MKENLNCNICGINFKNPIITASGTFGFGREYSNFFDLNFLGGISVKGLTLNPRDGNMPPRICETPMGILNSVGLQNPGVDEFIKTEIPFLRRYSTNIIVNVSGNSIEDYCRIVEKISNSDIDIIEMNISCPNIKAGGMAFGTSESMVYEVVSNAKKYSKKPLFVKLSPNVTDISLIAKAAENAGADGFSLINTLLGMRININNRNPMLANIIGGLSGPAIFPIAIKMIYQIRQISKLPIIGMGGISSWQDAIEMMIAGANIIAVGTALFADPYVPIKILNGMKTYMKNNNIININDIVNTCVINND